MSARPAGWARLVEAGASHALDPYLVWAIATGFRDYAGVLESGSVPVAIEGAADGCAQLRTLRGVHVSPLYADDVEPLGLEGLRHATALVQRQDLIDAMLSPLIRRMELGAPIARPRSRCGRGAPARSSSSDTVIGTGDPPWSPQVVIGIIDDFVAFDHPRLRSADGASRVGYVWSQDLLAPSAIDPGFWRPFGAGGHELCTLGTPPERCLAQAYPPVLRRATHGTHVADMAAGCDVDSDDIRRTDVIAVHLPESVVADTSGGGMNVHILDALRYIVRRAGPQARVVVNISSATTAGPHDGSSILERAIDDLVRARGPERLAVVVPAGNAHEARGHARFTLDRKHRHQTMQWQIAPDDLTPTFLEIWLPPGAHERVRILVRPPAGPATPVLQAPQVWLDRPDGEPAFGVVFLPSVANGEDGTMILLAVAATAGSGPGVPPAPHGVWTVELSHDGAADVGEIHAWIERDDSLGPLALRGRQSAFVDPHYERPGQVPKQPVDNPRAYVKRQGSFNTIATGEQTIVVGAHVQGSNIGRRDPAAAYSGSGPNRPGGRKGPDFTAAGEESATLHGVRAAGTGGIDTVRMNGTSVAAPQATRAVARLFMSQLYARGPATLPQLQGTGAQRNPLREGTGPLGGNVSAEERRLEVARSNARQRELRDSGNDEEPLQTDVLSTYDKRRRKREKTPA